MITIQNHREQQKADEQDPAEPRRPDPDVAAPRTRVGELWLTAVARHV